MAAHGAASSRDLQGLGLQRPPEYAPFNPSLTPPPLSTVMSDSYCVYAYLPLMTSTQRMVTSTPHVTPGRKLHQTGGKASILVEALFGRSRQKEVRTMDTKQKDRES